MTADSPNRPFTESDYCAIETAVGETDRGRWFLGEFARRNRGSDTEAVLAALARIEKSVQATPASSEFEGLRRAITEMGLAARIAPELSTGQRGSSLEAASRELDLIVRATEKATTDILKAAEQIQELAWTMREQGADEALCTHLDHHSTQIYTACSFQDLTGQRSGRVVDTLRFIEGRLATLIEVWGLSADDLEVIDTDLDLLVPELSDAQPDKQTGRNGPEETADDASADLGAPIDEAAEDFVTTEAARASHDDTARGQGEKLPQPHEADATSHPTAMLPMDEDVFDVDGETPPEPAGSASFDVDLGIAVTEGAAATAGSAAMKTLADPDLDELVFENKPDATTASPEQDLIDLDLDGVVFGDDLVETSATGGEGVATADSDAAHQSEAPVEQNAAHEYAGPADEPVDATSAENVTDAPVAGVDTATPFASLAASIEAEFARAESAAETGRDENEPAIEAEHAPSGEKKDGSAPPPPFLADEEDLDDEFQTAEGPAWVPEHQETGAVLTANFGQTTDGANGRESAVPGSAPVRQEAVVKVSLSAIDRWSNGRKIAFFS